jgi:hypothetical protein
MIYNNINTIEFNINMDSILVYKKLNKILISDISEIVIEFLFFSRSKPLYILYESGLQECIGSFDLIGFYKTLHEAIYKVKCSVPSYKYRPKRLKRIDLSLMPNCEYEYDEESYYDDYEKYEQNYDKYMADYNEDSIYDKGNVYEDGTIFIGEYSGSFLKYTIEKRTIQP